MALDRMAEWGANRPDRPVTDVGRALLRYLGGAMKLRRIRHGDRWIVELASKTSHAFPVDPGVPPNRPVRAFEVYVGHHHIDVMTRQADEYTNAVADGFFRAYTRRWGMKVEEAS